MAIRNHSRLFHPEHAEAFRAAREDPKACPSCQVVYDADEINWNGGLCHPCRQERDEALRAETRRSDEERMEAFRAQQRKRWQERNR